MKMCASVNGTRIPREYLGNRRPVIDGEARSDALLEGDIAYTHYTVEQRRRGTEERDGLEIDMGTWRGVQRRDQRHFRDLK